MVIWAPSGPIVRVAPNELSFINVEAWDDIYGFHVRFPPESESFEQAS